MTLTSVGLAVIVAASSAERSGDLVGRLALDSGLSTAERSEVSRGGLLAKVIETSDRSEVMTLTALRVKTPRERFLACAQDPSCLLAHQEAFGSGRVSKEPDERDVERLTLEARDRDLLARCRLESCGVRLSAEAIERFEREVDWPSPRAGPEAEMLFREVLLGLARRYAAEGDRGLFDYRDDDRPVRVADSLAMLLSRRFFLFDLAPELRSHLAAFPFSDLRTEDDYLCWHKEKFWRHVLTSLSHVAVYVSAGEGRPAIVVAVKQLYATHYHDSSLVLFAFVPGPQDEGLLVHLSRSRADIRASGFTWFERLILKRAVRGRLTDHLKTLKRRLEVPTVPSAAP